jgi:methylglutaconyl-CoA hydratase
VEFYRITYIIEKQVGFITLRWPERKNTLDEQMVSELSVAFASAQKENKVKAVILRSEGDCFCTGIDREYLKHISKYDYNQNLSESVNLMKLFQQIYSLRKPVLALVQGPALGSGCGLATVCDFILAAKETAEFGYMESNIGFIPAISLIFLVHRIGEGRARELVLSGKTIGAGDALNIGLASRVIPSMELEDAGLNLAGELIKTNSGTSMGLIKELLSRIYGMSTADALEYASNLNALARMTEDCKKGVDAFLNGSTLKW